MPPVVILIVVSALALFGCGGARRPPPEVSTVLYPLPAREPFLAVGADTSGLTDVERATFWHAAEHLNQLAGTTVYAPSAPVHVVVRVDGRDCETGDTTGWADGDMNADGSPSLGSWTMCLNLAWMTGAGGWAADRLIAHELLHTLGIGHDEDDPMSIMTPNLTARGATELRPAHLARIRELSE